MTRTTLALLLTVLVSLWPAGARADDGPGAVRLALGAEVLGWRRSSSAGRIGRSSADVVQLALINPRFGIEIGVVISPFFLLGVGGGISWSTWQLADGGTGGGVGWTAMPWAELALLPGEAIRPFGRLTLGAAGQERSSTATTGVSFSAGEWAQFAVGLVLGAHLFATEDVSIDPWVELLYGAGAATQVVSGTSVSVSTEMLSITLGVSLGAWLGGRPVAPPTSAAGIDATEPEGPPASPPPELAAPSVPASSAPPGAVDLAAPR